MIKTLRWPITLACLSISVSLVAQQQTRAVTAADYARAEKMLAQNLNGLVVGGNVSPNWLPDERFWYRTTLADGTTQTILVDPQQRTRKVCNAPADCPGVRGDATPAPAAGPRGGRGGNAGGA